MGEQGWLVECTPEEAPLLAADLHRCPVPGQEAVRVGATTVLVTVHRAWVGRAADDLRERVLAAEVRALVPGRTRTLDVVYDGADVEPLAALLGMSAHALVDLHAGQEWAVAFCGFAPGFAYLRGWGLQVPRLDSPRSSVPAGSVAVAGEFSAVYPSSSPGGWRLLGRTAARVWDADRDLPALLVAGDRVRYRPVRAGAVVTGRAPSPAGPDPDPAGLPEGRTPAASTGPALVVVDPGPLTLVEDLGRRGLEHLGVSPSGAADAGAARRANRLVGNERSAALLETFGGVRLRAVGDLVLAVTGAEAPAVLRWAPPSSPGALTEDGEPDEDGEAGCYETAVPTGAPYAVAAGEELWVGLPRRGLRVYVAVRGGVLAPTVLGSSSADVLGGLGPAPVTPGAVLQVGRARAAVSLPEPAQAAATEITVLRFLPGPRDDVLRDEGRASLSRTTWSVSTTSNRIGVRLEGASLARRAHQELPSEPMVPGAIQLPPSGEPVVLLRDHPVTGGYPVVGVVLAEDLDLLAQARPGDRVELRAVPSPERP